MTVATVPLGEVAEFVRGITFKPDDVVKPGEVVHVELDIVDPEGADVAVTWEVRGEADNYSTGWDAQATPLALVSTLTPPAASSRPRGRGGRRNVSARLMPESISRDKSLPMTGR